MKKIYLILLIFIFFFTSLFFLKKDYCQNNKAKIYSINNKSYCLLTASNQEQWEKGLMFYKNKKELKGADGMIFTFPNKEYRQFWNKNTHLDLDTYWLDDDKVVGKSYLPSIEKSKDIITIDSPRPVNKVIEVVR